MTNEELKKIWSEKFAVVPQVLENMKQVQAAATAFNTNVDAVVKISGAKIGIYNIQIHQYHLLSFSTEIHCKIYRKIGFSTAIMSGNNGNSFD